MEIDRWDVEVWAAKSRKGEVCGIFGCPNKPVVKCKHCFNMYCDEHKWILNIPGHGILVGTGEGKWSKGTRVEKINSEPGDAHADGAQATIVGALKAPEARMPIEYMYWVEWDDLLGIPVAVGEDRIRPLG